MRDFGRELEAAGEELEKAREAARGSEGRVSKLQVCVRAYVCCVVVGGMGRCVRVYLLWLIAKFFGFVANILYSLDRAIFADQKEKHVYTSL